MNHALRHKAADVIGGRLPTADNIGGFFSGYLLTVKWYRDLVDTLFARARV